MKKPRISICIPTYNRREYLAETICSITGQVQSLNNSDIEICVSDNASNDGTEKLIEELQRSTNVRIVYSRSEINMGADNNYLRAVELATGDYCWFMGSDDVALPGSLNYFLDEIEQGYDIYLCNRIDCDINLRPTCERYWLDRNLADTVYDLADQEQFDNYTKQSKSVGSLFSYLSTIVFRREKWAAIQIDPIFIGSAYSHAYMLLSFTESKCILKYCQRHLVLSRGGNDSFWLPTNDGIVKRIMIDIDGYLLLADSLFKDSPKHHAGVLRVLRAEQPSLSTLAILRLRSDSKSWKLITEKLYKAGYSKPLISLVGVAKPALRLVKQIRSALNSKM